MSDQREPSQAEQKALDRAVAYARDVGEIGGPSDELVFRKGWGEAMYWVESQSAS